MGQVTTQLLLDPPGEFSGIYGTRGCHGGHGNG